MPIYEYECLSCGERFEMFRSMADSNSDVKCPMCGRNESKRILSKIAIAYTGKAGESCAPSQHT